MAHALDTVRPRPVGARDIPLIWIAPHRLFSRVEDVTTYAWPLVILLTVVTLIGYATVETGLIEREVERRLGERIALIDAQQRDVVERSALSELYTQERKKAEFEKLLTRLQAIVVQPVYALAATLLIAAVLYGVVALTGRKVEWHTLMNICVFAGFIDVLRLLVQFAMMLSFGSLDVATSPAPLVAWLTDPQKASPTVLAAITGLLSAFDPFRLWFWGVVIIGLSATAQLPGWRAWLVCGLCWLLAVGGGVGLAVAAAAGASAAAAGHPQ